MDVPSDLRCLFSAQIDHHNDHYRVSVPAQEIKTGNLREGETYRVAILEADREKTGRAMAASTQRREPPVTVGERRRVEIEGLGSQGDGIARVEHGFVIIVPDTRVGEHVLIEIEDVQDTVAFATAVKRLNPESQEAAPHAEN